jgi:peptide/nickel transport system substrate-binding protein
MKKSYLWIGIAAVIVIAVAAVLMYVNPNSKPDQSTATKPSEPKQPETKPESPPAETKPEQPKPESPPAQPIKDVTIKNSDTYISVGIADYIETLDPAAAYDTSSGSVLFNVYETLIFLDGPHPDKFVPYLATEVPSVENGLIKDEGKTYIFPIRQGVKYHYGPVKDAQGQEISGSGLLTPEDVEYSFERGLLQDRSGGPQWMLLEPLVGTTSLLDYAKQIEIELHSEKKADDLKTMDDISPEGLQEVCKRVKATVEVEGPNAVFHLKEPFSPFIQILANHWSSILDREWVMAEIKDTEGKVIKKPGWDGSCETWRKFYDPPMEESELFNITNGTGPYFLERWRRNEEISYRIFKNYWRESAKLNVNVKFVREWATRLLMLQQGDADAVSVRAADRGQVYPLVDQGAVTMYKDLPDRCLTFWMPNPQVSDLNNPYIGSGKLDGDGIPPDFFSDIDVRKGFAHAFDWDIYIKEALEGDSVQVKTIMLKELSAYNNEITYYQLDLEKAAEHFKKAWGGQVWEKGFKLWMPHISGGSKTALDILQKNLASVNSKFKLEILEIQSTQDTQDFNNDKKPFDAAGWCEDYHDPHNWAFPLLGSTGYFGRFLEHDPAVQKQIDDLILKARRELDPEKRKQIYYEIEQINYDQALLIPIEQGVFKRFTRSWVKGFFWNMAYVGTYFWYLRKE